MIRSRLVASALAEPEDRLALQNALVIAKIARYEYPHDWPDLVSSLLQHLHSAETRPILETSRALLVVLHVVKELSTARLARAKQAFQKATPELVAATSKIWQNAMGSWRESITVDFGATQTREGAPLQTVMQLSLLAIKSCRRLLISGYDHPHRSRDVVDFWVAARHDLGALLDLQERMMADTSGSSATIGILGIFTSHILQLSKLHHTMASTHPASFVLLPDSLQLTRDYWAMTKAYGVRLGTPSKAGNAASAVWLGTDGDYDDGNSPIEKFALKGLLIVRACVKMVHSPAHTFKNRSNADGSKDDRIQATETLRQNLLTVPFVQEAMETLVSSFFVFRERDLLIWEEEPEEWEKREDGDGEDWEFSLRSCSEKLFLDLVINYKDVLLEPLQRVIGDVARLSNEDVVAKDAVYTALGLAAPVLYEQLDFDSFVNNVLVGEVQKQVPGFNIIRRRAAILLGQWISVKIGAETRPLVNQIFAHLLDEQDPLNDQVVRVTAARQLAKIIDDWETTAALLIPHAETMLVHIMTLISEVSLTETKMALLNTISVLVERLDHHISPFAERIVSLLPSLWADSEEEHLMKQAILTILTRLVNAMKADSLPLHAIVFPIIQGALEPGSETTIYLLEDASASQPLLELLQHLFPIYAQGSENLRKALEITESYVLLAPDFVLSSPTRTQLFACLAELLSTQLRPDASNSVCVLIEHIIRSASHLGGEAAVTEIVADLVRTGVLRSILTGLKGSWTAHCTTGPLAKEALVEGMVETDYFSVLARIILGSLDAFLQTVTAAFSSAGEGLEASMKWLLEEWFSHFENIGDPARRKLSCLAITKLLETRQPFILRNLQSLMSIWTDVVTELRDGGDDDPSADSLVYSSLAVQTGDIGQDAEAATDTAEDVRRGNVMRADEVHTVVTAEWIRRYLSGVVQAMGGRVSESEWVGNVDREVVGAFGGLGIM